MARGGGGWAAPKGRKMNEIRTVRSDYIRDMDDGPKTTNFNSMSFLTQSSITETPVYMVHVLL